jgi:hypothetical protein
MNGPAPVPNQWQWGDAWSESSSSWFNSDGDGGGWCDLQNCGYMSGWWFWVLPKYRYVMNDDGICYGKEKSDVV